MIATVFNQGALMRKIVLGVLALGLFVSLAGAANAADLYRGSYGWRSHHVWYGSDCCRRGAALRPGHSRGRTGPLLR